MTFASSKSPWAIRILTGNKEDRDSCRETLVFKAFESDVRAQVSCPAVPDASPTSPKKPRLLDSDSEADEPENAEDELQLNLFSSPPKQVSTAPARHVDQVEFTKIELDGLELDVGFHNSPGVLFPANAETVASVLKFLDQKI